MQSAGIVERERFAGVVEFKMSMSRRSRRLLAGPAPDRAPEEVQAFRLSPAWDATSVLGGTRRTGPVEDDARAFDNVSGLCGGEVIDPLKVDVKQPRTHATAKVVMGRHVGIVELA